MAVVVILRNDASPSFRDGHRFVRLLVAYRPHHHDLIEMRLENIQKPLHILFTIPGNHRQAQANVIFHISAGGLSDGLPIARKNRRPVSKATVLNEQQR
jgi:hypothetical protein